MRHWASRRGSPIDTTDSPAAELLARIRSAGDAMLARQDAVERRAPWPLSPAFGTEPESTWGPPEILAHVAEMLGFWLGEAERIVRGSEEPVPFGRVISDAMRIGHVERDRTLPLQELFARIASGVDRYERRLPELSAADLSRRGLHPTRGELTVAEMLERFVAGHLEEHVAQLDASLAD